MRKGGQMAVLRVLFICTANVARSAYAERRLVHLLGPTASVQVGSAGVPGYPGRPMDDVMAELLVRRGGSSAGHVSRALTGDLVAEADLILTMEFRHHIEIVETWPEASHSCFGLGQFADAADRVAGSSLAEGQGRRFVLPEPVATVASSVLPDSMTWDVADPHQRGRRAYRRCADSIDEKLERILVVLRELQQSH